ncbi:hypothetical protein [Hyphomonas sp.]|jgi:hypothetical protein|uniref:hypothetical protein n=1 Tax=Hyphomonas sp. TaxID=87 RepID=UPI001E0161E6|nr:hypothetical protein [Hyphomonas sp.]MCB9961729.1 hypothetical protein [Hyphomonas sp.]MCC0017459.1 hypothetical protein [Rhodobiaceae bacterium]HPF23941.1 hypothetical protein [Hyphomonas sp.]
MAGTKISEADFANETSWLTPKQCAELTGWTVAGLEKRRVRGQWPPYSIRAGRPRYPGDYIRQKFAEAVVTNTVQASTISNRL